MQEIGSWFELRIAEDFQYTRKADGERQERRFGSG